MISDRIGKNRKNKLSGKVMINDTTEMNQNVFSDIGAYVMQDDVLFEYFTPREALRFAARLKLGIPKKEQDQRIETLLSDLGLTQVAN